MPTGQSAWGKEQTDFYRIHRSPCDSTAFFGKPINELRPPNWRYPEYADFLRYTYPEDIHCQNAGQDEVLESLLLLRGIHIRDFSLPPELRDSSFQENSPSQAIKLMLQFLGMARIGSTIVRTNAHSSLVQQHTSFDLTVDTAVLDESSRAHRFLVITKESNSFDQLVACAIAAFQSENHVRTRIDKPLLESMIFPGMIWSPFFPAFYRIKITRHLADCVKSGRRPEHDTHVAELQSPFDRHLINYGLWHLSNRAKAMKILENMKDFLRFSNNQVPSDWYRFMTEQETEQLRNAIGESTNATEMNGNGLDDNDSDDAGLGADNDHMFF